MGSKDNGSASLGFGTVGSELGVSTQSIEQQSSSLPIADAEAFLEPGERLTRHTRTAME